ncbi:hypothetical protein O181_049470 [Austropuccinia psidii MF-1]|uniref:Uncharacterized protein n=1 Tax=Austropuccinia psidii MF-1 TaxID=1389203 RepID=A0A9Q3HQ31_9BASI|nr:hypothetical protein [Austropuccinia psidii MF-1]
MNSWLKVQSLSSVLQNKELELPPIVEKEGPVASTSFQLAQEPSKEKPKGLQKKKKCPSDNQGKGKGKAKPRRPYPQGYSQYFKIGAFSHEHFVQYGQNSYGVCSQGTRKD